MDVVGIVISSVSSLWTCGVEMTENMTNLKRNLNTLQETLPKLRTKRDDVARRVELEESSLPDPVERTNAVRDWFRQVEDFHTDAQKILDDSKDIRELSRRYFLCCGRRSITRVRHLGDFVYDKMIYGNNLLSQGDFQVVTSQCQPPPLQQPTREVVGMDAIFKEVVESLEGNQIVGLYGLGGVGKTTLLDKVYNEFSVNKQFCTVLFVEVSKVLDLKRIQMEIGRQLGVTLSEEIGIRERAQRLLAILQRKKGVLLVLDDIWEYFELTNIGVSEVDASEANTSEAGASEGGRFRCQVLLATRNEQVCRTMAKKSIEMECLNEALAWSLFEQKVKEHALSGDDHVVEIAKEIVKMCCGLPLALNVMGSTMCTKTLIIEWRTALACLKKLASLSEHSGMVEKVFPVLKYSYDKLENQKLKSCFLSCSIWPESMEKKDIIQIWAGEGLLDSTDDANKVMGEGLDVMRCLQDACLLQTGTVFGVKMDYTVKMHDLVRDMAIGIVKNKHLTVQAETTLKLSDWEEADRISLRKNTAIERLDGEPRCSNLSTLFLVDSAISFIADEFLRSMKKLKVLDMTRLKLIKLPESLFSLSELQFLNLPEYVEPIRAGSLAALENLKTLGLSESCCNWVVDADQKVDGNSTQEADGPRLEELEHLQHLIFLQITIETGCALKKLLASKKLQLCTTYLMVKHITSITSLSFLPCSPVSGSSLSLGGMSRLSTLELKECEKLEELRIVNRNEEVTSLETLENLYIAFMPSLRIEFDVSQGSCSLNLKQVTIVDCPRLQNISWLIHALNLEVLILSELEGLQEIISDDCAQSDGLQEIVSDHDERKEIIFPRLNVLGLGSLSKLEKICNHNIKFHHLEKIVVSGCPNLKKLPFDSNSVISQALMIEGWTEWWDTLVWEDEATKSNMAPRFSELP